MWSIFSRDPCKDFAYELGEIVITNFEGQSVWTLVKGSKKGTNEPVSIFKLEIDANTSKQAIDLAKSAIKRLKTLRHPSFVTYLDSFESDKLLCVVTEPVQPLKKYLEQLNNRSSEEKSFAISYGIYQISSGLSFLNNDVNLHHNNIHLGSIFVDSAAVWKIGGLEYITAVQDNHWPSKLVHSLEKYDPPERKDGVNTNRNPKWARDAYGFGCFVYECFNGELNSHASLSNHGKIPKNLRKEYDHLICNNPSSRCNFTEFLSKARSPGRFLKNRFVDAMIFLDELQLKDMIEKNRFFNSLNENFDNFPQDICLNKMLPQLILAFEYNNASASTLSPLLKLGKLLPPKEYEQQVVPCLVKLFSCKDRATRAKLLQQMDLYINYLKSSIVNEQLYVHVCQGFVDSSPTIREQTVKCMLFLASKLSYSNLNEDMLKHFARLQVSDPECSIRANTTVCLGKIAAHLHPQIRQTMLIPSFLRSMRDPFPPARIAAIQALEVTQQFYSLQETATKVMPALCHMTMDQDKTVRDQAFKILKQLMEKIERVSENPSVAEELESELNAAGSASNSSVAASWASWAVSSFTSKLAKISKNSPESKDTTNKNSIRVDSLIEGTSSETTGDSGVKNSPATRMKKLSIESRKSTSSVSEESVDDWGKMEDNLASLDVADELESALEPKDTDGWDGEDQWQDFPNDHEPIAPTLSSFKKDSLGKKSISKKDTFDSFAFQKVEPENVDEEESEYSYTSRKSSKPKTTDDDMWASLEGGKTSKSTVKKSLQMEEDDLFASLSAPVVRKATRLANTGQKKRGPLKLGAQKLP